MDRPLRVIHFDSEANEFVFDEQGYAQMLLSAEESHEGIRDLPVAIVSVVGDARKGKSFLINFFIRFLERHDQEDWLGDPEEPLEGFSWRDGVERETVGIVLWPKPFVLTRSDGSKIVVILMDTQGFFDDQTDHMVVEQFYTISTIVSSLQIYNQMRNIQSNDVTLLSKFSEYSERISNRFGHKAFQRLLFLVRDWPNQRQFEFGFIGGKEFLEHKRSNQRDHFGEEWNKLNECFSQIGCFLMSSPGDVVNEFEFNGSIRQLKPQFSDGLKELIPTLLSPDNIVTKSWRNEEMPFWRISHLCIELIHRLSAHRCIDIGEVHALQKMVEIGEACRLSRLRFLELIVEAHNQSSEMNEAFEIAENEAFALYNDKIVHIHGEETLKYFKRAELSQFFRNSRQNFILHPSWWRRFIEVARNNIDNIDWRVTVRRTLASGGFAIAGSILKFYLFKTL